MATIAALADSVQNRLEEPVGAGSYWKRQTEVYPGLIEACNELMMLVGRPTQVVSVPFSILPNTPWQKVPAGMLCITNIQGSPSEAWKRTLEDMDYLQAASGSDWTQDVAPVIFEWFPIGFNMFAVHPVVPSPQTVLITGIQYPVMSPWPYDGTQAIPFSDEFFSALEEYGAHYCRLKEGSNEFSESLKLLQSFIGQAARMTQIQDRRDDWIFSRATGVPMQVNPNQAR